MLVRLLAILPTILVLLLVALAVWRRMGPVAGEGRRSGRSSPPEHGQRMVRDPVCGTFVLPSRALSLGGGSHIQYFCSEQCRTTYKHRPETSGAAKS